MYELTKSQPVRPKKAKPKPAAPAARKRDPREALPQTADVFKRPTYRTGDGDIPFTVRPGSMDHLKFKSKGNMT